MPKISELPETTGSINLASLLPLVQSGSTTKTTFSTLSANIFDSGVKFGTYTAKLVSGTGTTDPVYTEQFFTNGSRYALIGNKLVLYTSIVYVQAGSVSNAGSGTACILLPPLGTYLIATGIPTWHQKFDLGSANLTELGCSVGSGSTRLTLRGLNTVTTAGGSPDVYFAGAPAGSPVCPAQSDMGLVVTGWGILQ